MGLFNREKKSASRFDDFRYSTLEILKKANGKHFLIALEVAQIQAKRSFPQASKLVEKDAKSLFESFENASKSLEELI